jgi:hypothetical protein
LHIDGGIYTGAIQNGLPHGYGDFARYRLIAYISNNYLYSGEYQNGKMHGKGTLEDNKTGIKYTGAFLNGKITGFGKYIFLDGSEYEGGFLDGKFEGDGTFTL